MNKIIRKTEDLKQWRLKLKSDIDFIPTMGDLHDGHQKLISIAKNVNGAAINDWQDIDRLDVRPSKGVIKIRSYNRTEIQIDASSGKILHVAERNSDVIESIHDGTFFEKNANIWLSLPVAIISIIMVVTGTVLFLLPYFRKNKRGQ